MKDFKNMQLFDLLDFVNSYKDKTLGSLTTEELKTYVDAQLEATKRKAEVRDAVVYLYDLFKQRKELND